MPMSPVLALDEDVVAVLAGAEALVAVVLLLLLPHAASTKAPKLAAPALPAIFRKRLRSESSRTRRSTIPAGCGTESSLGGLGIFNTSALLLEAGAAKEALPCRSDQGRYLAPSSH